MHNTDKEALEQAKQRANQPNGQHQSTHPSNGIPPVPTPITVAAAKTVAGQNQQQFNQLVVAYLVQGFFQSDFTDLGAIGQAIADEASLGIPLTLQEFRTTQALPPAK